MNLPPKAPGGASLPHRIGIHFWPETWDGSDLFSPEGTTLAVVVQRVRDVLEDASVTNVQFERLTEAEQLAGPWEYPN